MTDIQQKYFLTVAEELSFSRAASSLYVSQPAVSKQIAALEAELGFSLFDRTDKGVQLTYAGETFREFLIGYQQAMKVTMNRIKSRMENSYQGTVKLGCPISWNAMYFYDRLVGHFATNYPNVKLELEGFGLRELVDALRSGQVDVALVYDIAIQREADIASKSFTELEMGLLYSSHRFSSPDASAGISAFSGESFIISEQDGGPVISRLLNEICAYSGFTPKTVTMPRHPLCVLHASCGQGVLFMDEWAMLRTNSMFEFFPSGHKIPIRLAYTNKNMSPLKSLFVNEAATVMTKKTDI